MKRLLSIALLALSLPALAGLEDLTINSSQRGEYVLGVIASDQRPYVVSGETPPNVAGAYIKGVFRIRTHIKTDTETPVADEITAGLRKALTKNKWLGVATIATTHTDTAVDVASLVKTAKLKRTLVVTVNDLWAESYRNTTVNYGLTISVFDEAGKDLAKAEVSGQHDTREWGCDGAAEILSKVMADTLAKPEFVAALK